MPLLRDIAIGRYVPGDGFLHQLDPRTKLLSLIALMGTALMTQGLEPVAMFTILVILIALSARLPVALLLRNLRSFAWLIGVTALLHLFMTPGTPRWVIPHVTLVITHEGASSAALFSLRLAAVVTAASMLTLTNSFAVSIFSVIVLACGMGFCNAAVFKLVPQIVPDAIGGTAGWIGGIGALGGFVIPPAMALFVNIFETTGYARGFLLFVLLGVISLIVIGKFRVPE